MAHYVKDGAFYGNVESCSVIVESKSDLAGLPDDLPVGTLAYTAGFKNMWQKDADGEWAAILEVEG